MYNQNANNELFLYVLIRSLSYLFFFSSVLQAVLVLVWDLNK